MKNQFIYFALYLGGLPLLLGSCTVNDHQIPNPANCRLNTFSVKSKTSDLIYGEGSHNEIMEIDGKQVKLRYTSDRTYTYDEEGRIGKANGGVPNYEYQYLPGVFKIINKSDATETSFPRNEQGYMVRPGFIYNAEGYLIQTCDATHMRKYKYVDGNLVKEEIFYNSSVIPSTVFTYEYDLSKPNIPNIETFTGKKSRNLPVKVTSTSYPSGSMFSWEYRYTFDEKSQVKQRITIYSSVYEVDDYSYAFTCQ